MFKTSLPTTLKEKLELLEKNLNKMDGFGIIKIGIFGSYVVGNFNKNSDLDILIEFKPGKETYKNFLKTFYFLENLFKQKIDLVTVKGLSHHMKDSILNEVVFVERKS